MEKGHIIKNHIN